MASTITDQLRENCSVLLLGASGQLGQMLRHCWSEPPNLVCQSRLVEPDFITFDLILEPKMAVRAMHGKRAVICLSGVTPARVAATQDGYSGNTDLALAAVRAAAEADVPRLFLASSAAVYGAAQGIQDETTTPKPLSEYGHAKRDMEIAALDLAASYNLPVTILRIGNVAGADAILGGWRKGMQIDQLPDGSTPRRSYIGPETLARVLAQLCQIDDLPQVLNITAPGAVQMGALLTAADLPWSERPAPETVIPHVELSTQLLERYVSFRPQDGTAAGLVAEWQRYEKHKARTPK